MTTMMITSAPEVNQAGVKRWFLGDIDSGLKKVFLYESTAEQRKQTGCPHYKVTTYLHTGEFVKEQSYNRTLTLNRHLRRMFGVDVITLGEDLPLQEAA